jgi:MFS family permease
VIIVLVATMNFVYGQEQVLFVLVSKRLLGTGTNGFGFLLAASGVGGVAAAGISSRLAADDRPSKWLVTSAVAMAIPIASLSVIRWAPLAYLVLTLEGAGVMALDVVATTAIQRLVAGGLLARVNGLMMSLAVAGTIAGALLAPVTSGAFGLRPALVLAGSALVLAAIGCGPSLRGLDDLASAVAGNLAPRTQLLERLAIFQGAPRGAIERVAAGLSEQWVPVGQVVIREHDAPDDLFVVVSGALEVTASGESGGEPQRVRVVAAGQYFGEIGLLHGVARTATVTALADADLYRIRGDDFLDALQQSPAMRGALVESASARLASTHPLLSRRRPE